MQCGLCCDRTFFGSVAIDLSEKARLARVGLRVVEEQGAVAMPQPCVALADRLCSVYADRPTACAQYECSMRERVKGGTTTAEAAHATVTRMRRLLATMQSALSMPTSSIWDAVAHIDHSEPTDPASPAGRRFDDGVRAVSELLELAREVFEAKST